MLKRRALKKILITTLTIVILLMMYMIPDSQSVEDQVNSLNVEKEIEYIDQKVGYVYLLNNSDLLVKVNILMKDTTETLEKVKNIIENLQSSSAIPSSLHSLIPKKTKILDIQIDDGNLSVNFSREILEIEESKQEKLIESITYSLFEIEEIKTINIYVEEKNISQYFNSIPEVIDRDFGINKQYHIHSFQNIQKVVVYYLDYIDDTKYLVPITSYVNNEKEKIKIIIENLSSSYIYEPNLISLLDSKTELINYEMNDDVMLLNFNNSIFMNDGKILEEVVYTIGHSIFDNYSVSKVVFQVENKNIEEICK